MKKLSAANNKTHLTDYFMALRPWYGWLASILLLALLSVCLDREDALASKRSEVYRQSRAGTVLLVSVNKITRSLSFGTGFFVSQEGHILTNAHVLDDQSQLLVYVPDQGVYPDAKTVFVDHDADMAVIHLPKITGRALPLSKSIPEEGTDSLVVGFPRVIDTLQMGLALHSTIKPVTLSAFTMGRSRTEGRMIPFLQVSGILHAGTSGGPLVHADRMEVFGMVVHSVPYIGQAKNGQGALLGTVMLRADMSYVIPATVIRQWLADHQIPHVLSRSDAAPADSLAVAFEPHKLGMSLFLTGHLVYTIADTVNFDSDFLELALPHYEKALEIFPGKTVIARNLALVYRSLHRYQEAVKIYEKLLQQSPSDLLLMTEAAQTWKLLHKEDKAIPIYRTVLKQESCYLDALNGLGNVYLENQEYAKAVQMFQEAVKCVPSSAYASYYLGESMARAGQVKEAYQVWKGSLERINIHTLQEKEVYDLMRERLKAAPALLSHASLSTPAGQIPNVNSQD
jgi:Tfp pilus assembly protein PilF